MVHSSALGYYVLFSIGVVPGTKLGTDDTVSLEVYGMVKKMRTACNIHKRL